MQRSWMDNGVQESAAPGERNDKIGRKFRAEPSEKQAAKARQTERQISGSGVDEPRKEWELRISIAAAPRSGAWWPARGAVVHRGGFTLGPVDLRRVGDRAAYRAPTAAESQPCWRRCWAACRFPRVTAPLGSGGRVGEVDQTRGLFLDPQPLSRAFGDLVPDLEASEVRTLLAKFGLQAAHVPRPATSLSPAERTRAALALLQARGVNLLVLDEPTNHLDVPAIQQLEEALESYTGTLLLVTHDRRMLEAVTVNRWIEVAEGLVTQ